MAELKAIIERYYDAFNRGDLDEAAKAFSPDVETIEPGVGTLRGAEAWKAYGASFKRAMPDARLNLKSAVEQGNMIAVEGTFTGTHTGPMMTPTGELPPTGRAIELPYIDVFRIENGLLVTHRVYYDQITMLSQLGLIPAPAAV
ncbi:MAG: ester cyclase [Chloroflexota bacterium]|nr:ester cyclase [Chloroflexota bacterium]